VSALTIRQGQTVREIAERLGVSAQALGECAAIADIEAPMTEDRLVQLPAGFLGQQRQPKDPEKLKTQDGMNPVLALGIEYRRGRAEGVGYADAPSAEDTAALEQARVTYLRFEPESNELAFDLYRVLTASKNATVRAAAFAGQAIALAQKVLFFGEPSQGIQGEVLSLSQAGLLADPKLGPAHIARGLGLCLDGPDHDLSQAFNALERAVELHPKDGRAWAHLGEFLCRGQKSAESKQAIDMALELLPECVPALIVAAQLALQNSAMTSAKEFITRAIDAAPLSPTPIALDAALHQALGDKKKEDSARQKLEQMTENSNYLRRLNTIRMSGHGMHF